MLVYPKFNNLLWIENTHLAIVVSCKWSARLALSFLTTVTSPMEPGLGSIPTGCEFVTGLSFSKVSAIWWLGLAESTAGTASMAGTEDVDGPFALKHNTDCVQQWTLLAQLLWQELKMWLVHLLWNTTQTVFNNGHCWYSFYGRNWRCGWSICSETQHRLCSTMDIAGIASKAGTEDMDDHFKGFGPEW